MRAFLHDAVDSTNDEARRLIERGAVHDAAYVVAREQTGGRGTRGRTWSSPRDAGIYLSLIRVFPRGVARPTMQFTLAAGVACAEVIEELAGVTVALKPVNDLCAGGGKLGGILAETSVSGADVTWIIIGAGINLRAHRHVVAPDALPTVSLEELAPERSSTIVAADFAAALALRLSAWCDRAVHGDTAAVRGAYARRLMAGYAMPEAWPEG